MSFGVGLIHDGGNTVGAARLLAQLGLDPAEGVSAERAS